MHLDNIFTLILTAETCTESLAERWQDELGYDVMGFDNQGCLRITSP